MREGTHQALGMALLTSIVRFAHAAFRAVAFITLAFGRALARFSAVSVGAVVARFGGLGSGAIRAARATPRHLRAGAIGSAFRIGGFAGAVRHLPHTIRAVAKGE